MNWQSNQPPFASLLWEALWKEDESDLYEARLQIEMELIITSGRGLRLVTKLSACEMYGLGCLSLLHVDARSWMYVAENGLAMFLMG